MGITKVVRIITVCDVFALIVLLVGCGGGSSSGNPPAGKGDSSGGASDDGSGDGGGSGDWSDVILQLRTLQANITIRNISVTNLDCLKITDKVIDSNSTAAHAIASYEFADLQTESQVTSRGFVTDDANDGRLSSSSSLEYDDAVSGVFAGSRYSLSAKVSSNSYGYAHALASMSEMVYFTAERACDITISIDYSGTDDGINPGHDSYNYSYAGINYQIANFNDALSQGLAINVLDAEQVSPGTLTTTMHFDAGESGWITLGVSAGASIYRPDPSLVEGDLP